MFLIIVENKLVLIIIISGVVRVGRGVGGFGLYLTWKSMYQISASYCAWPGSLILFKFQPSQGIGLSGVLRLMMGGGEVHSLAVEKPSLHTKS